MKPADEKYNCDDCKKRFDYKEMGEITIGVMLCATCHSLEVHNQIKKAMGKVR